MSKIKTLPETPSRAMDSHTYDLKEMSALPRLSSSNPNHIYLITQWMQTTTMVEWIYRSLEKCSSPTIIKWLCSHSVCLLCAFGSRCPDDLTKKYWCHANNILQIHRGVCFFYKLCVMYSWRYWWPHQGQVNNYVKFLNCQNIFLMPSSFGIGYNFSFQDLPRPHCLPCWVVTKLKDSLDLTAGS